MTKQDLNIVCITIFNDLQILQDLNVIDVIEPTGVLGGPIESQRFDAHPTTLTADSHTNAVLTCAADRTRYWN